MLELITPTARLHTAWLAARDDWGRGVHQDGSGLQPDDDVDSPEGFATWVRRLHEHADESRPAPEGLVATFALGGVLTEAGRRGLDPVLVTCDVDNVASTRTIERHGGVLEDVRDTELGQLRRYWIHTA